MFNFDPKKNPMGTETGRRERENQGDRTPMREPQQPDQPMRDPSRMPGERPGYNPLNEPEYRPGETPAENPSQPGRTGEIFPGDVPNTGEVPDPDGQNIGFRLKGMADREREKKDDEDLVESDDTINLHTNRRENPDDDFLTDNDDLDEWTDEDDVDLDTPDEDEV